MDWLHWPLDQLWVSVQFFDYEHPDEGCSFHRQVCGDVVIVTSANAATLTPTITSTLTTTHTTTFPEDGRELLLWRIDLCCNF